MKFLSNLLLKIIIYCLTDQPSISRPRRLVLTLLRLMTCKILWLDFPPQFPAHFCPIFILFAQMVSLLPRWGLFLPRIKLAIPFLYSAVTPRSGICTNIKRSPIPPKTIHLQPPPSSKERERERAAE